MMVSAALSCQVASIQAGGDKATLPAIKAAFLYNFAKFTDWPPDSLPPAAPLVMCISDTAVADSLIPQIKGRNIAGHPLEVRRIDTDAVAVRACHTLYVSDPDEARLARVIDAVAGAAVLTVSDYSRFAALGGVIQFIVESGRMRFAVNVDSMRRQRTQLSSKVLQLASLVKDQRSSPWK
jgi:YfiR/HmsC-like